jgi:hypothetical protein
LLIEKQEEKKITIDIIDYMLNIRKSISIILFNISNVNVEITYLVLNIIIKFFHAKNQSYKDFHNAIKEYK